MFVAGTALEMLKGQAPKADLRSRRPRPCLASLQSFGTGGAPCMARWLDRLQLTPIKRQPGPLDQQALPTFLPAASQADPNPWVESCKLLLSGGVAGAVSKTATAPLARLTILLQVQALQPQAAVGSRPHSLPLREAFAQVVRNEGFLSLWKGNGVTILHRLPYSAVNFWAYERSNEVWKRIFPAPARQGTTPADVIRRLMAGATAGMTACALAYPLDLVRTRLAAQTSSNYYHGIAGTLSTIVRDEGFAGLYRGLGATLLQVAPSLAVNYCAYETLRSLWMQQTHNDGSPPVVASLACGSIAGLAASSLTFPLDLVRRRLQLEGQAGRRCYRGSMDVFQKVVHKEGIRGLYAGIVPEYFKVVPGVAIAFCAYEVMKKSLSVKTNLTDR